MRPSFVRRCCRVSTMEVPPILDRRVSVFSRTLFCSRGRTRAALFSVAILAVACQPTIRVEVPREPITINLNIKLDAVVLVKIEEQADKDIANNPDIF